MKSSRSKRRRLTYVSSRQRPDLPAIFESLNDDTLTTVLEFVGDKSYRSFGGTNKQCREVYLSSGLTKETFLFGYAPLSVIINKIERGIEDKDWEVFKRVGKGVVYYNRRDLLDWALQEQYTYLWNPICYLAAREGRIDILDEMWNNIDDDDKRSIFGCVDYDAARGGKLNVLKWVESKGLLINEMSCAGEAAINGHLHIIQWLQEEKGLQLYERLYDKAIDGGHLHVLKWLREQEVPWSHFTFYYAALEGNLDILQWLHNEGCPWPEDYRAREEDLIPEVVNWLRVNGYGDRIIVG